MVESSDAKESVYTPSENEKKLLMRHLGDEAVVDPGYLLNVLLSRDDANKRKEIVSDIEYDFQLALQKGEYFFGNAVINFYVNREPEAGELFLNFRAIAISKLTINDAQIEAGAVFKNQRIRLDKPHIVSGWNTVQLRYMAKYGTTSVALHTYTDKADGLQYLYSQFEAYHCHKVFPVFDQPNLKAKMSLAVTLPAEWNAASNGIERRYNDAKTDGRRVLERHGIQWFLDIYDGDVAVSEFEQTPKISCYLYAICAGPYHVFSDTDPMYVP